MQLLLPPFPSHSLLSNLRYSFWFQRVRVSATLDLLGVWIKDNVLMVLGLLTVGSVEASTRWQEHQLLFRYQSISDCLSVGLPSCQSMSVCGSICASVGRAIWQSVCLSICVRQSVGQTVGRAVSYSVGLPIDLCVSWSVDLTVSRSVDLCVKQSDGQTVGGTVSQSVDDRMSHLSVSLVGRPVGLSVDSIMPPVHELIHRSVWHSASRRSCGQFFRLVIACLVWVRFSRKEFRWGS